MPANATAQTHEYVRVGGFYVNSKLSTLELGRYLWEQAEQFLGSEGKTRLDGRRTKMLPAATVKASRILRHLSGYVHARNASRSGISRGEKVLELPVTGDLAIVRRSGAVKVLDVRNRRVFTVVRDAGEQAKLRERVGLSESVSHLPFAPSVWKVDLPAGYFAEEFVSGSHPVNFAGCGEDFVDVYRPLLVEFLISFPTRRQEFRSYVDALRDDILAPDGLLRKMGAEERRTVTSFVERTHAQLAGEAGELPLVLSHGDYFSGNIVIDGSRHRAIDWANMGFRSPLHDLYYLYVNHCCRVLDWPTVHERTRLASQMLKEGLAAVDPERLSELSAFLDPGDRLRRLFYLECVQVPLVRCTDPRDRYLDSMLVRVGWFEEYERALAQGTAAVAHEG